MGTATMAVGGLGLLALFAYRTYGVASAPAPAADTVTSLEATGTSRDDTHAQTAQAPAPGARSAIEPAGVQFDTASREPHDPQPDPEASWASPLTDKYVDIAADATSLSADEIRSILDGDELLLESFVDAARSIESERSRTRHSYYAAKHATMEYMVENNMYTTRAKTDRIQIRYGDPQAYRIGQNIVWDEELGTEVLRVFRMNPRAFPEFDSALAEFQGIDHEATRILRDLFRGFGPKTRGYR